MAQPCKLALNAAATVQASGVSVNILPFIQAILTALFPQFAPILAACIPTPAPTPANARDFVANRYNTRKERYARGILNKAIRGVEDNAPAGCPPINDADAETIAIASLDAVRLGSDADIQEAMQSQ